MIELRITGETPQDFFKEFAVMNAVLLRNMTTAVPVVESGENGPPTVATTEAPVADSEPAKKPAASRKKKDEPAPDAVAAKQAADEATPVPAAEEIDVPKDLDGMRALLSQVLRKHGVDAVNQIVHPIAPVLSKVPVDEYPKIARLAHKKLAEDAA